MADGKLGMFLAHSQEVAHNMTANALTDHLADCDDYAFSGAGFHPNCERICICRQVRRIEKRVLDAAREEVAAQCSFRHGLCATCEAAIAAIDALREKP